MTRGGQSGTSPRSSLPRSPETVQSASRRSSGTDAPERSEDEIRSDLMPQRSPGKTQISENRRMGATRKGERCAHWPRASHLSI